jgi:superfamily II DNA helicase RecQ
MKTLKFFAPLIVFAVFAMIASVVIGPATCQMTWGDDFRTRYDVFSGCKVEVNGKFWPEAKVRATDVQ